MLSLAAIQGILVTVHVIGGTSARAGGALKMLLWTTCVLFVTASIAMIFYAVVNLKPPPGKECMKWDRNGYNSIPAPGSTCDIRRK